MRIRYNEYQVGLHLKERLRQTPHKLTPEERKDSFPQKYDYTPNGILVFQIGDWEKHGHWADLKRKKLEDRIDAVVQGVIATAAAKDKWEQRRKAEEQERWERYQREQEEKKRREEEQKCIDELLQLTENWHTSQRIKEFATVAWNTMMERHGQINEGSEFHKWHAWALTYADLIDPLGARTRASNKASADPEP